MAAHALTTRLVDRFSGRLGFLGLTLLYGLLIAICLGTLAKENELSLGRNPVANLIKTAGEFARPSFVDAWLGNWDVAGLSFDNLLVKDGKGYRIDVGGSLRYLSEVVPGDARGSVMSAYYLLGYLAMAVPAVAAGAMSSRFGTLTVFPYFVGAVTLVDCVAEHASPWFVGPYGFVLDKPEALPFVPLTGQLGFFAVTEMRKEIER